MYYKNLSFLVAGLQKSGLSSAELLISKGATVFIYDKRQSDIVLKNKEKLISLGCVYIDDYEKAVEFCDVLVVSPGVPIDSDICKVFKSNQKRIIGETELGFINSVTPIVSVTGTNGKTTVCNMIHKCLLSSGVSSVLAGNVGYPLTSKINELKDKDICVLEVSSYQLETTYLFCPHISVVLNITPDHLERHYSMENYALVKSKAVIPLRESEYAVLNYDDEIVRDFSKLTRGNVLYFSLYEKVNGAYLDGDKIFFNGEELFEVKDLSLKESHNLLNALATVCALKALKISNEDIKKSLCSFKGVKHRYEEVRVVNGVKFINDSKSTNEASSITAVQNLKSPTVLILGGADKGLDYTNLFSEIKNSCHIKHTIITGESAALMLGYAVKGCVDNVMTVKGFENAVKTAYRLAFDGDTVLLSPATSSFDEFKDYEERGDRFVEIVNGFE
ncbi:MAG: UDP-N-acetylmuramoyl-L-alanine--D-glutamate ligase [Clostridia bacterium]|nr:UDP-N-acetylmuramoyl-L-alanine--D-glutamate ligase [Clostridia bacterium]